MEPDLISQLFATLPWQCSPLQEEQCKQLYAEILEGNRHLNLTRITDEEAFWEKHIWDSLSGLQPWLSQPFVEPWRAIDIGTGGGFPGLVAAIALPQLEVTLLDSTRKKITFLQQAVETLKLNNVKAIVDRAEALGHHPQHRSQYDLALIRAVGPATVCAEYALPLLKIGGTAVLYRGQWTEAETQHLTSIVPQLGGAVERVQAWKTPLTEGVRHCLYLRKTASTPKSYPRAIGIPAQSPL
ncbi:MAG: 16S rRNA (guanine(527)-N(7))-methyltransferase RsmG [Prochlorotrichaceae cyanobacterium]